MEVLEREALEEIAKVSPRKAQRLSESGETPAIISPAWVSSCSLPLQVALSHCQLVAVLEDALRQVQSLEPPEPLEALLESLSSAAGRAGTQVQRGGPPAALPRDAGASKGAVATVVEVGRGGDGLDSAVTGPSGMLSLRLKLQRCDLTITLEAAMSALDLGDISSYRWCPHCGRFTTDSLEEHEKHDSAPQDGGPKLCTSATVYRLGVEFAQALLTAPPEELPLTSMEPICAINTYTMESPVYRLLNRHLRNNDEVIAQWVPYIHHLQRALGQLPNYTGTVYRGIDCEVDPALYVPGHIAIWPSFSSSTTSAQVAKDFLATRSPLDSKSGTGPAGTLFIIDCSTGTRIEKYSALPNEEEVLFGVGTQLRVKAKLSGGSMSLLSEVHPCVSCPSPQSPIPIPPLPLTRGGTPILARCSANEGGEGGGAASN